ncbi:MAG: hypothetical protein WBA10_19280 [Elainellaceae cyanobacterium]
MSSQYSSSPRSEAAAQTALTTQASGPAAPPSLRLSTPTNVSYEYLHHILIGSPHGVNDAVHRLHLMQYVEKRLWTPLIAINDQGLTLTQAEGQVLRYLVQQRPR